MYGFRARMAPETSIDAAHLQSKVSTSPQTILGLYSPPANQTPLVPLCPILELLTPAHAIPSFDIRLGLAINLPLSRALPQASLVIYPGCLGADDDTRDGDDCGSECFRRKGQLTVGRGEALERESAGDGDSGSEEGTFDSSLDVGVPRSVGTGR
jgi:hypothetical protein